MLDLSRKRVYSVLMMTNDTRLAFSTIEAYRLGIRLVRLVVSDYENTDRPADREYHIEVCEAPVRGRSFSWRRLDTEMRHRNAEARQALDWYKANLSHTVIECETVYEVHRAVAQ